MSASHELSRSYTKRGPGRIHGQGLIIMFNERPIKREPQQRLKPARVGGYWQGAEYLTFAEHDRCKRLATFGIRNKFERNTAYNREVDALIEARNVA